MSRPETRRLTASQFRIIPYWDNPVSLSSPNLDRRNPGADHGEKHRRSRTPVPERVPEDRMQGWGKVQTALPETAEAASTLCHLQRANSRSMAPSASGCNHHHRDGEAERPQLAGGPLMF
ncbi:hypothetical protein Amn_11730 [Aminobacter sp. Y103A]|nr:hypothetical protein Amn_11730 [Aminobacter sp. SS-2016]